MPSEQNNYFNPYPAVIQTGFRIFFLGAALHAIFSMGFWMGFYIFHWDFPVAFSKIIWHGHEMIYGYTMAVVAGFLLTAVTNWTGRPTLTGLPLFMLFLLWVTGRVLAFMPSTIPQEFMAFCDILFLAYLIFALMRPIVQVKQWRQLAILSKVILILMCNIFFYIAFFTNFLQGTLMSMHFAIYMIVSLILTIGRRIIPFFVEKGVGYSTTLRNSKFLDIASLVLLVCFSIIDVFWSNLQLLIIFLSALLAIVHTLRLVGWYTPGIWKKPLLWVLFVGYAFLIAGFIFKIFHYVLNFSPYLALHAFTYGGIGIFSVGMMARVSLGHTGRNIHEGPPLLSLIFMMLTIGACIRVFVPIVAPIHYALWICIAQCLWIISFTLFLCVYFPILVSKRVDGKFG